MNPSVLRLVRYAMLTGVVGFGGFAWYHSHLEAGYVQPTADLSVIRIAAYVLCAVALAGMFVLKGVRARADAEKRTTFALVGSALGEAAGFMGAVYMMMGGEMAPFILALVVFLASWTLLPADPDEL
jgi:FtsH-binding integral membrane protein